MKSCESFLRKTQFSTLTDLNPGFGGSWDMLGIFFVKVIFITLQKKSFCRNIFWIPCTGSRVPFCQNWKIAKISKWESAYSLMVHYCDNTVCLNFVFTWWFMTEIGLNEIFWSSKNYFFGNHMRKDLHEAFLYKAHD